MPFVLILGAAALMGGGGIYLAGEGTADAANATGAAAEKSSGLAKVLVIGGALYMLYRTAQAAGAAR